MQESHEIAREGEEVYGSPYLPAEFLHEVRGYDQDKSNIKGYCTQASKNGLGVSRERNEQLGRRVAYIGINQQNAAVDEAEQKPKPAA